MDSRKLSPEDQQSLLNYFKNYYPYEEESTIEWQSAAPLLALLISDREMAKKIKENFNLIQDSTHIVKNVNQICGKFIKKGILQDDKMVNPYYYRLPQVMGEYPRHSKPINNAIKTFNHLIESKDNKDQSEQLHLNFLNILHQILIHGQYCFSESLADLFNMMSGYSSIDFTNINDIKPLVVTEQKKLPTETKIIPKPRIRIIDSKEKNKMGSMKPFLEENAYHINSAGRLVSENSKLVVNGFGLKFGGHFDALLTHTPALIQLGDFYSILWRELSQRMELPVEDSDEAIKLRVVLLSTLRKLGIIIESTHEIIDPNDLYISPFNTEPQAFMTPIAIKKKLREAAEFHRLSLAEDTLLSLSDYLSQVLYRMQFNMSEALGIGANDDNTVSYSNAGRDYIFQFNHSESEWATRFAHVSKHRQGPAQPHMNAAKGVQYELAAAFLTETERMNHLQQSEYEETIYNAIIDNLVTDLFPHPDFFENTKYKKYRKQHFLTKDNLGRTQLSSYNEESAVGIFKENGQTTPRFRRAGTIDIHPLPKDHGGICEAFKSFNSRNPLAAKQFQYIDAMQNGTRGHYIYNPFGPDSFIADMFEGQVIKNSDGSFIPFIGIIPKNFDKELGQPPELCASFVIRMLQSSRLMSHCPTFSINYQRIKNHFLVPMESIPDLPKSLAVDPFLREKMQALKESLDQKKEGLSFQHSEKLLTSLFKNIIYHFRAEHKEKAFSSFHYHLINDPHFLKVSSRDNFEKVIRVLKINAPIQDESEHQNFLMKVNYLESIIKAFYPEPSSDTAKLIKEQANLYKKPLTRHFAIKEYFELLQKNPRANLSRRQSPGMLFVKLRDDAAKKKRTLDQKFNDFDRMHQKNFIAGYRDQEGSLVVAPTNSDQFLDFAAKGVAKLSVAVQNDSNPIGQIIASPIVGAYHGVKNNYGADSGISNLYIVPLGLTGGLLSGAFHSGFKVLSYGTKFIARPGVRAKDAITYYTSKIDTTTKAGKIALAGVFIPAILGIVTGIAESFAKLIYDCTINPIDDLFKFCSEKFSKKELFPLTPEHALHITALPDNEPGFKIKMSDKARDIILKSSTPENLLKKLKMLAFEILEVSYPELKNEDKTKIASMLFSKTIMKKTEWEQFYEVFNFNNPLGDLLQKNGELINNALIYAVYHCYLERSSDEKRLKMIDRIFKLYKLLPEQKKLLQEMIIFYNQHPGDQEDLIMQFSEEGIIKNKLSIRDSLSQKMHDAIMQIFDVGLITRIVNDPISYQSFEITLQIENQINKASRLIEELKNEIRELKSEGDDDIAEIEENIKQLSSSINQSRLDLQHLYPGSKASITAFSDEMEHVLSNKDKAHLKWKLFAKRELLHDFLTQDEVNKIFTILDDFQALQKSNSLQSEKVYFKKQLFSLMSQCNTTNIDNFYSSYLKFKNILLPVIASIENASHLLETMDNLVNTMMNTALNKILDKATMSSRNPLSDSKALSIWLLQTYQNKADFQSLLTQQHDRPFMHLTILRQAYIIQCVENALNITEVDQRIRKTGLQKLLRIHYLERNVVKRNGVPHYESRHVDDFEIYLKSRGVDNSPTFQYASNRIKKKIGIVTVTESHGRAAGRRS